MSNTRPFDRRRPGARGFQTALPVLLAVVAWLGVASCNGGTSEPGPSLIGTWDLIGFTDAGVAAATTGTAVFRADGTFSIDGTITFPGEPTEAIAVDGTFQQSGNSVDLTIGADAATWTLGFSDSEVVLTEVEPPPANTITLRRRQ